MGGCALWLLLSTGACLGDAFEACPEEQRVVIDPERAEVWPPVVHTGYNGRDTFLSPVSTNFVVDRWVSSSQGTATISGYPQCGTPSIYDPAALITSQNSGTVQVTAIAEGVSKDIDIVITEYSTAATDIGEQRYRTDGVGTERRSCAGCHDAAGGVDHTPLEMAFHDDASILSATKDGHYPNICTDAFGVECTCNTPNCDNVSLGYVLLGGEHVWDLTEEEETGIIAYMRSLRPRGL